MVVLRRDILPTDFLQTPENYVLSLTIANIERFKNFHHLKIWSIFSGKSTGPFWYR